MLNFGPWAVPLVFLIFGYCVGRYRQAIAGLDASDARFLLVPIVTLLCMNAIIGDSDNYMFNLLRDGTLPYLIVLAGVSRLPRSQFVAEVAETGRP
jgi:hypothetical protein